MNSKAPSFQQKYLRTEVQVIKEGAAVKLRHLSVANSDHYQIYDGCTVTSP